MHVALVTSVENDGVFGRFKNQVHGKSQLNHAEIWPQMATGSAYVFNQKTPDLFSQVQELPVIELPQILGIFDLADQRKASIKRVPLGLHAQPLSVISASSKHESNKIPL